MIYFAQAWIPDRDDERGPVKIGYARDPAKRIASLQTGCPHELVLVHQAEGGREGERAVHAWLAEFSMRGEWFWPSVLVAGARGDSPSMGEVWWVSCSCARPCPLRRAVIISRAGCDDSVIVQEFATCLGNGGESSDRSVIAPLSTLAFRCGDLVRVQAGEVAGLNEREILEFAAGMVSGGPVDAISLADEFCAWRFGDSVPDDLWKNAWFAFDQALELLSKSRLARMDECGFYWGANQ